MKNIEIECRYYPHNNVFACNILGEDDGIHCKYSTDGMQCNYVNYEKGVVGDTTIPILFEMSDEELFQQSLVLTIPICLYTVRAMQKYAFDNFGTESRFGNMQVWSYILEVQEE